jgi:hypothetical protein
VQRPQHITPFGMPSSGVESVPPNRHITHRRVVVPGLVRQVSFVMEVATLAFAAQTDRGSHSLFVPAVLLFNRFGRTELSAASATSAAGSARASERRAGLTGRRGDNLRS